MRVRELLIWAACATSASFVSVYLLVPPGQGAAVASAAQVAPSEGTQAPPPVAEDAERATSLIVEARIGHDKLLSSGDRRTYLMIELRGREGAATAGSLETSTALVIDTSGSMAGVRIAQAEEAARRWVQRAPDGDMLAVIGFSQQANVLVPRTQLEPSSRRGVLAKLTGIRAAGETCLSCGVQRAASTVADPRRIQRVVVLSDGRANVGVRDVLGVRALASMCRDRGVSVSTIGLGTGYNEKVLSALAFDANGLHHFVQDAQDLPKVFEREERTLRATVAADVRATVQLSPGVELVQVLDRQFGRVGQEITIDVGPIAAGATRTVLLEVSMPGSFGDTDLLGNTLVATTSVAFREFAGKRDTNIQRKFSTTIGAVASSLDGLVAMRLERARTGAALQRAAALFAQGRKQEALALLDERVSVLGPRSSALSDEAQRRGDGRAEDIRRDLKRQIQQADGARRGISRARPKSKAPVKRAAPMAMELLL